jgi:indolepyruvate ferredoxin oxidoreductase beta subunit
VQGFSREHHVFDMGAIARESGTVVSAVMLGAIAGSGLFPFKREDYETVVRGGDTSAPEKVSKMAAASLRGFARAYDMVSQPRVQASMIKAMLASNDDDIRAPSVLPAEVAAQFPAQAHTMLSLGYARMLDYQDAATRSSTCERLARCWRPSAKPTRGRHDFATTREMARWLALWMAFDDIVRVADLKSRAPRWQRVQGEVKAGDDDLLQVYDHFKPGAPEFAALLPPRWRTGPALGPQARAQGQAPWALPLKVGTPLGVRHAVAARAGRHEVAARARQPLCQRAGMIEKWLAAWSTARNSRLVNSGPRDFRRCAAA